MWQRFAKNINFDDDEEGEYVRRSRCESGQKIASKSTETVFQRKPRRLHKGVQFPPGVRWILSILNWRSQDIDYTDDDKKTKG